MQVWHLRVSPSFSGHSGRVLLIITLVQGVFDTQDSDSRVTHRLGEQRGWEVVTQPAALPEGYFGCRSGARVPVLLEEA